LIYGMDAPCHGCKDRKVGCHDRCERYQEYRQYAEHVHEVCNVAFAGRTPNNRYRQAMRLRNMERKRGR